MEYNTGYFKWGQVRRPIARFTGLYCQATGRKVEVDEWSIHGTTSVFVVEHSDRILFKAVKMQRRYYGQWVTGAISFDFGIKQLRI
jgi:hypothetical protein